MGGDLELTPGTLVLGKLRVIRKLGAGGIGAVYEVEHELTKHRRALKVLHSRHAHDAHLAERFLREASAAGRIGNPHIVETFDAGRFEDGTPWLLMELLHGEALTETLRRNGRLDVGAAAALLIEVCGAVGAAHAAGIVHRDLKPDNLFVTVANGRPFVKVLDFGISKFEALGEPSPTGTSPLGVTASGVALGTPLYMAPEQMRGAKDADARADVYALGVVLYECVAGGVPYFADSWAELAARVLQGGAAPLEQMRADVPKGFADAVSRAMALKREDRFQSTAELALALGPYATSTGGTWWTRAGTERELDETKVRTEPASVEPRTAQDTLVRAPEVPPPPELSVAATVVLGLVAIVAVSFGIAAAMSQRSAQPKEEVVTVEAIPLRPPPLRVDLGPAVVVPAVDAGPRPVTAKPKPKPKPYDAGLQIADELAKETGQ